MCGCRVFRRFCVALRLRGLAGYPGKRQICARRHGGRRLRRFRNYVRSRRFVYVLKLKKTDKTRRPEEKSSGRFPLSFNRKYILRKVVPAMFKRRKAGVKITNEKRNRRVAEQSAARGKRQGGQNYGYEKIYREIFGSAGKRAESFHGIRQRRY